MTGGWICDVIENRVRCTDKKESDWDLEAPEIGMAFRINLCDTHKRKIQLIGQVEVAIAGEEEPDIVVDSAPERCPCRSTNEGLYVVHRQAQMCPDCRHVPHPALAVCGVKL